MSRVITFYSYKGGTGRSMALANVAWILASAGNRVLTIDWDLEAPGLHRYFHPFLTDKELTGQESQGVIDMVSDFAVRAATPATNGEKLAAGWYEPYADFSKWRQKLHWPSGEPLRLGRRGKGEIDFVSAGRQDADYAKRVNYFDWHSFYEKLGGGAFFDAAKRKFDAYDYVLIDSRTGVSDTSGICTVQMPDTLVVCFTLNYQSIKGASAVTQSIRERRPDLSIFPLPTRIDRDGGKSLHRMKNYATNIFSSFLDSRIDAKEYWYRMEIPYFTRYAYAEKLALFEEQSSITASALPSMALLSDYLTDGAVQSAGKLPDDERAAAQAEFDEGEEAEPERLVAAAQSSNASPARIEAVREAATTGIFISFAAEDRDVAEAVAESLHRLGDAIDGRIKVFLDSNVPLGGDFQQAIQTSLAQSDFLIVIDAGGLKDGFSYVGFETGVFSALMANDASRRIVCLYSGKQPAIAGNFQGINIADGDLSGSREEYVQRPEGTNSLTRFFLDIAEYAEIQLPPTLRDNRGVEERIMVVNRHIIPDLRRRLFDSLSARPKLSTRLGATVEFDLPAPARKRSLFSIPDDARLALDRRAFEIFRLLDDEGTITWRELRERSSRKESSILLAIEQIVISAVSSSSSFNNSQIVRSAEGEIYRAVATRRMDYYNGRKVVDVYFAQQAVTRSYGNSRIPILLQFVNQVARTTVIFERDSPFSVEAFMFVQDPAALQEKVGELLREMRSLLEASSAAGLNELSSARIYLGDESVEAVRSLLEGVSRAYDRLLVSGQKVLDTPPDSAEFPSAREQWLVVLNDTRQASNAFNSVVAVRALNSLKEALINT
jgi:TIR domain/CobQ/CobB/MinD/ParA nucleotide binding domain